MPRRTHARDTRKVAGGEQWKGRHRLDRLPPIPRGLRTMLMKEEEGGGAAGAGGPAIAGPGLAPTESPTTSTP